MTSGGGGSSEGRAPRPSTPPAPPKDADEGAVWAGSNTPLNASNLASLGGGGRGGEAVAWEGEEVHDEERGSEATQSSQRSSEQDSIFNADNEGDADESSSESEDEEETLVG